jgi:hypothetical protein
MDTMNFAPVLVVNESPDPVPVEKLANVTAPGVSPFVISKTMDPSALGAVMVIALFLVMYWSGHLPGSAVIAVLDVRLVGVTLAPPETVCPVLVDVSQVWLSRAVLIVPEVKLAASFTVPGSRAVLSVPAVSFEASIRNDAVAALNTCLVPAVKSTGLVSPFELERIVVRGITAPPV